MNFPNEIQEEVVMYIVKTVQEQYPDVDDVEFAKLCEKMASELTSTNLKALDLHKKFVI